MTSVGFCDIQNNQGLGKGYVAPADNPYLDLDYSVSGAIIMAPVCISQIG